MASQLIVTGFDPEGPFADMFLLPQFRKRCRETRFRQEWKLTLPQYVAMRDEFRGPKRQRGNLQLLAAVIGDVGVVVLTDHQDFDVVIEPFTGSAGFIFETTGTLGRVAGASIQSEWWNVEPETGIGSSHEVRALSAGKVGTWDTAAASDNVWVTISSDREWSISSSSTKTTSATFEVGEDGVETAIDSATLTATVTVTP